MNPENYYKRELARLEEEWKLKAACIEDSFASFLSKTSHTLDTHLTNEVLKAITEAFDLGLELGLGDCEQTDVGNFHYSVVEGMIRQNTKNPTKRS